MSIAGFDESSLDLMSINEMGDITQIAVSKREDQEAIESTQKIARKILKDMISLQDPSSAESLAEREITVGPVEEVVIEEKETENTAAIEEIIAEEVNEAPPVEEVIAEEVNEAAPVEEVVIEEQIPTNTAAIEEAVVEEMNGGTALAEVDATEDEVTLENEDDLAFYNEFKEKLFQMDPEQLRAIDKELEKVQNSPKTNYITQIQVLLGELLAQFNEISDFERGEKRVQKIKYAAANKDWGTLQKEMGDRGLLFTGIGFGLLVGQSLLSLAVPGADRFKDLTKFFAENGCTTLQQMFNGETQSKQKIVDGISQLAISEINAAMNKTTPNNEQFTRILDEVLQILKTAARPN